MGISEDRIQDVYNLVSVVCKKYNCYNDDKVQDLTWDVWQIIQKKYDDSKGALSTFIAITCRNLIFMETRSRKTRKNILNTASLDKPIGTDNEEKIDLYDCVEDVNTKSPLEKIIDEEKNTILNKIYNECSPLLQLHLQGRKQKDAARQYKIETGKFVYNPSRILGNELKKIKKENKELLVKIF